jgi:tetratricopeptide (TPR) repeat protein
VFRGTFNCSVLFASNLYFEALAKIYDEKPALETAEQLLRQSISLDPSPFFVHIRLGNLCLKRGSREDALTAYSDALQYAPADSELRRSIREQIKRVSVDPLDKIPELRSPQTE